MDLPLEKFGNFNIENKKYINNFIVRFNYKNKVDPPEELLMIINERDSEEDYIKEKREIFIKIFEENKRSLPVKEGLIKNFKDLLELNITHIYSPDYIYTNGHKIFTVVKRNYLFESFSHKDMESFFNFPGYFNLYITLEPDSFKNFNSLEEADTYIKRSLSFIEAKEVLVFKEKIEKKILLHPWFYDGNIIHFEGKSFYLPLIEYEEPYSTLDNLNEKLNGYSTKSCGTCFYFAFSGMSRDMSGGSVGYCERFSEKWGDSNKTVNVFDLCKEFRFIRDRNRDSPYIRENYEKKISFQIDHIIAEAIWNRASHIHIETAGPEDLSIKYRIEGLLEEVMTEGINNSLGYYIKIMAKLDMSETILPQEGKIQFKHDGKDYDLIVSTIPTVQGEKMVININFST